MTQNPYGPPPGQQYPPQPATAPAYQQPPQQQGYAAYQQPPVLQYGTPPAQALNVPPTLNSAPLPSGSGDSPALHQLGGRLLLIQPQSFQAQVPSNMPDGKPRDQVIADVVIIDGPPIDGKLDGNTGILKQFDAGPMTMPWFINGMFINGVLLTDQLRGFVETRGFVLGRLGHGVARKGKPPYILLPQTPQDTEMGQQIAQRWEQLKAQAAAVAQQAPLPAPAAQPYPTQQPQYQQPAAPPWQQPVPPPPGPPPGYGQQPPQYQQPAAQPQPWSGDPAQPPINWPVQP